MILPLDYCPQDTIRGLFKREDITTTAQSFKSWDTCMDNKTCKIVAIVGLSLAALLALWIFCSIIRCIFCGFESCFKAFCCCFACCGGGRRDREIKQAPQTAYTNPHMYPQQQNYQQPTYQPVNQLYYGRGVVSDESSEKMYQFDSTKNNYGYRN